MLRLVSLGSENESKFFQKNPRLRPTMKASVSEEWNMLPLSQTRQDFHKAKDFIMQPKKYTYIIL